MASYVSGVGHEVLAIKAPRVSTRNVFCATVDADGGEGYPNCPLLVCDDVEREAGDQGGDHAFSLKRPKCSANTTC